MNITWREAHEAAMHFADYSHACAKQAHNTVGMESMDWMERSNVAWGQFTVYSGMSDILWNSERHAVMGGSRR